MKRIVYTSLLHADTSSLDLAEEHLATERTVRDSGIPYTILRNGWYTKNLPAGANSRRARRRCVSRQRRHRRVSSSAARADFASAAVAVLTSDRHEGKTYELAGDKAWTLSDLAAGIFTGKTGRTIPYKDLPRPSTRRFLRVSAYQKAWRRRSPAGMSHSQGALFDDRQQLSALIGQPTTPLSRGGPDCAEADRLSQSGCSSKHLV